MILSESKKALIKVNSKKYKKKEFKINNNLISYSRKYRWNKKIT